MFRKRTRQILEKFDEISIIKLAKNANFYGQESKGWKQVRGNGVLLLTAEELFFEMWFPKKILRIPLYSIKRITSNEKSHLRKTNFRYLLKVFFQNEEALKLKGRQNG